MADILPKGGPRAAERGESKATPSAVSADRLITFYVVIVALALEQTAEQLFPGVKQEGSFVDALVAGPGPFLSLATILTLVPFAHGALRHLDLRYIHVDHAHDAPRLRRWALLADFFALLAQGMLFLAMARYIARPLWFLGVYMSLLAIDVVWAVGSKTVLECPGIGVRGVLAEAKGYLRRLSGQESGLWPQMSWAYNNILFLSASVVLMGVASMGPFIGQTGTNGRGLAVVVLVLALLRTTADYWVSWTFYFPDSQPGRAKHSGVATMVGEKTGARSVDDRVADLHPDIKGDQGHSLPGRLRAAYAATTFCADTPDGVLRLRVGDTSAALDELLEARGLTTWAFVTAHNPASVQQAKSANDTAQARLLEDLLSSGLVCFEGDGVPDDPTWPPERSVLILGISLSSALALGRRHGQLAIIAGRRGEPVELAEC